MNQTTPDEKTNHSSDLRRIFTSIYPEFYTKIFWYLIAPVPIYAFLALITQGTLVYLPNEFDGQPVLDLDPKLGEYLLTTPFISTTLTVTVTLLITLIIATLTNPSEPDKSKLVNAIKNVTSPKHEASGAKKIQELNTKLIDNESNKDFKSEGLHTFSLGINYAVCVISIIVLLMHVLLCSPSTMINSGRLIDLLISYIYLYLQLYLTIVSVVFNRSAQYLSTAHDARTQETLVWLIFNAIEELETLPKGQCKRFSNTSRNGLQFVIFTIAGLMIAGILICFYSHLSSLPKPWFLTPINLTFCTIVALIPYFSLYDWIRTSVNRDGISIVMVSAPRRPFLAKIPLPDKRYLTLIRLKDGSLKAFKIKPIEFGLLRFFSALVIFIIGLLFAFALLRDLFTFSIYMLFEITLLIIALCGPYFLSKRLATGIRQFRYFEAISEPQVSPSGASNNGACTFDRIAQLEIVYPCSKNSSNTLKPTSVPSRNRTPVCLFRHSSGRRRKFPTVKCLGFYGTVNLWKLKADLVELQNS